MAGSPSATGPLVYLLLQAHLVTLSWLSCSSSLASLSSFCPDPISSLLFPFPFSFYTPSLSLCTGFSLASQTHTLSPGKLLTLIKSDQSFAINSLGICLSVARASRHRGQVPVLAELPMHPSRGRAPRPELQEGGGVAGGRLHILGSSLEAAGTLGTSPPAGSSAGVVPGPRCCGLSLFISG